jgi:hypothetical protein
MTKGKITERKQSEKLQLSPSAMATYNACPHSFILSRKYNVETTSEAAREGQLLEGYVFGFQETGNKSQSVLEGRKKAESLDLIKAQADYLKPLFLDNTSFQFLEYESDYWILRGEMDYIGRVDTEYLSKITGAEIPFYFENCILDLKRTNSIQKMWDAKEEREQLLQSVCYPYMMWKKTGVILPFLYLVVESSGEKPICRVIDVEAQNYDMKWVEGTCNEIAADFMYEPKIAPDSCGGSRMFESRCKYAQVCEAGRAYLGGRRSKLFSIYNS